MTSATRKKVLWVSHLVPYPPKGGVLIRSYHLIRELARHHDVDVIALNQSNLMRAYFDSEAEGLVQAEKVISGFVRNYKVNKSSINASLSRKISTAILSLITPNTYTIRWLWNRDFAVLVRESIEKNRYDLVHFDTISLAQYRPRGLSIPTILDHHNVESHMMLRRARNEQNLAKKAYFYQEGIRLERYERRVLREFDSHIVCSDDDRRRLLQLDSTLRVTTVPNGVLIAESFPRREVTAPKRLLFIGGLDWYPNADAIRYLLREIWPLVKTSRPDLEFHVVGKNPPPDIAELAKSSSGVHLHGFVDDISSFYSSAALYVCPIRDGGGTKLKIIDAMANGVPVLAHPIACEGLGVTHGENVLLADTPEHFAEVILSEVDRTDYLSKIGAAGFRLAKSEYGVGEIGKNLADLVSQVAEHRPISMSPPK